MGMARLLRGSPCGLGLNLAALYNRRGAAPSHMIRVRYMSDTSARDERTIRWGLDETSQGDAAGGGAFGPAPGRAQPGSQARNDNRQMVPGAPPEAAAHRTALW